MNKTQVLLTQPQPQPYQRLYTEQQTLDLISNSYDLATKNHLTDVTVAFLEDVPLDDWPRYLRHVLDHLAQFHPYPGPFLIHVAQQLTYAAQARINPA